MPANNDIMAFNKAMAEQMEAHSHSKECNRHEKLALKAKQLQMKQVGQERAFVLLQESSIFSATAV
jgi:hypothetical protein